MPAPLPLRVLGVAVDLQVGAGREWLREELASRWALCLRTPHDRAEPRTVLTVPDTDEDLATLMVDTTQTVTRAAIEGQQGRLLMFHAAGLADPASGAAAAFVAAGGTGKTTLCRTLGRGRRYLSDETVGITVAGEVVPYAKPLSVRTDDWTPKDEVDPRTIGLSTDGAPALVVALVLLDRAADHTGPPTVVELDLFEAIIELCPETSSLAQLPDPLQRIERLVHETRPVLKVRYAEAGDLEPLVSELIGPPR